MLPVGGMFRFTGTQLTSREDENTDDPLLVYKTEPDVLYGNDAGLVVTGDQTTSHWTISPAVDADEAILEAPLSSLARTSTYLSKAFEFATPRWAPFIQFWIELVPIATEFTRTLMRGGAQIYSLAVGKTPMFYDADYTKNGAKNVPISLNVSMDCGWGQKPKRVHYHANRLDDFYDCYYRRAKIVDFPVAEYFILRRTPWYYVHMRGELALALWFSDAYTATERPIHLLVASIEAMADDPSTADVENAARVAIPRNFSFMDLELATYIVHPENGTKMKSVCPILHCPDSMACSLAVFTQATAQVGYMLLRTFDILNIIGTYQQHNLGVDLYPLACTTAQFSVGGGGLVASWAFEIIRLFHWDDNKTDSYFNDFSVGLSVPGRALVTYPLACMYLYSQNITFDNLLEFDAVQETINHISPPVIRGSLFMMKESLGILSEKELITYADMNNFYETQVKPLTLVTHLPGNVVVYIGRTFIGGLSIFTSITKKLTGQIISQDKIMGRTPSDFYGTRHLSRYNFSGNAADAWVQYQFDSWGSVFGELLGLFIGESMSFSANVLNIPLLQGEYHRLCHDEDSSAIGQARKFFNVLDDAAHTADDWIENALNNPMLTTVIGGLDEFTKMIRRVVGGLVDAAAKPLAGGLEALSWIVGGVVTQDKGLHDAAKWFESLGANAGDAIPDVMKVMQDISNYIDSALHFIPETFASVGLSWFTQDKPTLGWNEQAKRFDETRLFSVIFDTALAPHINPGIEAEFMLWAGAPLVPGGARVAPGLGLSYTNANKLLETDCGIRALGNVFKGFPGNSAPELNTWMNEHWNTKNPVDTDLKSWTLPDNGTWPGHDNRTRCQRKFDIDFGPSFPIPGIEGVTRYSYATAEDKDANSILRAMDNITEVIFTGVRESCGIHSEGPTRAPTMSRRRLLSTSEPPWLDLVDLLLDTIEIDPRSVCDERLLRARAMGVVSEKAKVCALKRTVYMKLPSELLTMPIGYYYDDSPLYERFYTYRHDILKRLKRRLSDSTEPLREMWSPRPERAVTRTRRARDVDDLWNDVLVVPRVIEGTHGTRRRLLSTGGDECLTCAVWDDVRDAVIASVQIATDQYAMITSQDPHTTSKQMQEEALRLSRATHMNGWRYMEMDDVIPYRVGHWIHESFVDAATFNVVHFIRACPMADMMNVTAMPSGIDKGLALAATFGAVIFAISTPALLKACKSLDPLGISVAFVGVGLALYYVMSVVFLWTTYDVPITCNVPYPMIPFNMWDDIAASFTRWIPGCMCSYFPLLVVDETPCDASCGDRDYSYYPCVSVIDDFGLIWSLEYPLNYFLTGVLEFRDPDVAMTPYDRTEHSCWLLFTAANAPLMFIFASAFFVFLASCTIILLIVLFMSVQAHLHLLRDRRTAESPPPRRIQTRTLPTDKRDSQSRLLTKKIL